jgi:hypothetical protein
MPTRLFRLRPLSLPMTTGAAGRHDNYGSALSAQPGESQRRPATNPSSKLIVRDGLPPLGSSDFVAGTLPAPPAPSCSRCLCPGCSQHTPQSEKQGRNFGTGTFIPVTNPIESVFATVRHRTIRTKGALSQDTARLMVFKLVMAAAKTWRKLKGENQLPKVIQGIRFQNGVDVIQTTAQNAA